MNRTEQVETYLNTALSIDNTRTDMITIENDMLIIDLNYYSENVLADPYNRVVGGYLSIRPEISVGQLSYALVPENASKPVEAFTHPQIVK